MWVFFLEVAMGLLFDAPDGSCHTTYTVRDTTTGASAPNTTLASPPWPPPPLRVQVWVFFMEVARCLSFNAPSESFEPP